MDSDHDNMDSDKEISKEDEENDQRVSKKIRSEPEFPLQKNDHPKFFQWNEARSEHSYREFQVL